MSNVTIRRINLETDLPMAVLGVRDFISRMDYKEFLPDTDEEIMTNLLGILELEYTETLVADYLGAIVGGIGLLYAPGIWNPSAKVMEELFWWVSEHAPRTTALKLLRAARQDALSKGCKFTVFKSLTSSPHSIDKVYRKMGLRPIETSYMGALS